MQNNVKLLNINLIKKNENYILKLCELVNLTQKKRKKKGTNYADLFNIFLYFVFDIMNVIVSI
jgi:hypothetical protein